MGKCAKKENICCKKKFITLEQKVIYHHRILCTIQLSETLICATYYCFIQYSLPDLYMVLLLGLKLYLKYLVIIFGPFFDLQHRHSWHFTEDVLFSFPTDLHEP